MAGAAPFPSSEDAADPDALAIAIRAMDAAPTDGGANLALRAIAAVGNLESFADPVALDIHAKPEVDFSALIKPESCGIHDDPPCKGLGDAAGQGKPAGGNVDAAEGGLYLNP